MAGVVKFVFALLLGFLLGAGATVYVLQSGAADLFIRKTDVVADLQRKLDDAERQRADLVERAGRMESAFADMEKRFRVLQDEIARGQRAVEPAPGATP